MAATKTYARTLTAARKIGADFRESLRAFDGAELFERFSRLADDLPEEGAALDRHNPAYVRTVIESAAVGEEVDRDDARKFARHFLSKKPHYSNSKAGVAAVMFEAWIAKSGGQLFSKFVETVLDNGEANFLAIFEGKLTPDDVRRMKSEVGRFVKVEPVIEAGAVNYADSEIMEFTLFDCEPAGDIGDFERVQPKKVGDGDVNQGLIARSDTAQPDRNESLLPEDRFGYDKVFEDGGLSRAAARFVLGDFALDSATVNNGRLVTEDANGTPWVSVDGGTWFPDVDALEEEGERPPNYRKADGSKTCARCRHFDEDESECELFEYVVKARMTCDRWAGVRVKDDEPEGEEDDDEPEESAGLGAEGLYGVEEDDELDLDLYALDEDELGETPLDDQLPNAPIYEVNPRTGAARSFFEGSWAVFQDDVLDEGAQESATIVVVGEDAYALDAPFVVVEELIEEVARTYPDLLAEGDKAIEAVLRELAEEQGTPCENAVEVCAVVESADTDRPTVVDRDYEIRQRLAESNGGKNERDADTFINAVALQVAHLYKGVNFNIRFDGRFGSGSVMVTFSASDPKAPELDHLNAKLKGMISITPFDPEGVAVAPKVKAEMFRGSKRELGWRNKTGTLDQVRAYLIKKLKEFAPKVRAAKTEKYGESIDEKDDEKDDEKEGGGKKG